MKAQLHSCLWSHIHSFLIIRDCSFTKAGTSHINHIPHMSHSSRIHNSHKNTKTWKLGVIKLTYLETRKFKKPQAWLLELAIACFQALTNNHQQPHFVSDERSVTNWWAILWIHFLYMDGFVFIIQSQYRLQKLWNLTMNVQLYYWSFTTSTNSIKSRST